jgi:hypothetical protein
MSVDCEVILRWDAPPAQQRSLGHALWNWCTRSAGSNELYQYLDNQALADLMAGQLPASSDMPADDHRPYVFFTMPGDVARDRDAILDHLRLTVSNDGIADVRIGGVSWNQC